jgi:hypothetical protein
MSEGASNGNRARCPACASRDRRKHTDDELKQFHPGRWQFEEATRELHFTKDFNPALEAIMRDSRASIGERVLAWTKRQAWGNFYLYCVKDNGEPVFQVDCAAELGVDKRRVCGAVKHLVARGYIEMRGTAKLLFPVIRPHLDGPPRDASEKSAEYQTFLQDWRVAHSADFSELEVARSTVARIRKVLLSDYKQWRASRTESGAIKEESLRVSEKGVPPPPNDLDAGKKAEDDDATSPFRRFKELYPRQRFDEDKAKPFFLGLRADEQRLVLERLERVFLSCPRWVASQEENDGQFIPLASTFLARKKYKYDPPPRMVPAAATGADYNVAKTDRLAHGLRLRAGAEDV